VDAVTAVVCPKCSYARKASDTAPAWQCPSCGIAYKKFHVPSAAGSPADSLRDKRERGTTLGQGSTTSSGIVYVSLLGAGIFIPGSWIWLVVLPVLACATFYYWFSAYARQHMIENMPTSRIATAAQGYVELCGTVAAVPGDTMKGPLTHHPCVWYAYGIDEQRGKDKTTIESGSRSVPFLIRDGTGECLVNPRAAEILCETSEQWDADNRHYSEWSIRIGDPVYAIGRFSTRAAQPQGDPNVEINAVVRSWLADPRMFFARFDADRNGKIAAAELAEARAAARSEVYQSMAARAGGVHTLVAPDDDRPFIIMNMGEARVDARFRELTYVHLVLFFVTLGFWGYNLV
jgi:hypothetical protein